MTDPSFLPLPFKVLFAGSTTRSRHDAVAQIGLPGGVEKSTLSGASCPRDGQFSHSPSLCPLIAIILHSTLIREGNRDHTTGFGTL